MATSVDSRTAQSETNTAVIPPMSDSELNTAINSTLRSRGKASTRTALSTATAVENGPSYEKMISAFTSVAVSYFVLAISFYIETTVSLFHLAYFSYRNPAVSKDLIKTAFHLLKTSYDNKLLTFAEIIETTQNSMIKPMAHQNKQHFLEENQRTAQLQTMKTSTAFSR
ncbi:uncharacterized protein CELE_T23G11.1 [Caenorhabditis elegans]|uniref:Transmembrane protein n=1 Tax=Caenorhabditis elegans TaxID=6239 RepID=Q9XVI1_CAEEL|nr:Transmembrane protein [Caenorhabditis elegans]CAB03413.1 Transmembrane protein [Caenorhabditis elegans]|eukprot:NP_492145.1 Uncharacterized protein CELE_T23G11.1 [Caenorhabditis elegans]